MALIMYSPVVYKLLGIVFLLTVLAGELSGVRHEVGLYRACVVTLCLFGGALLWSTWYNRVVRPSISRKQAAD